MSQTYQIRFPESGAGNLHFNKVPSCNFDATNIGENTNQGGTHSWRVIGPTEEVLCLWLITGLPNADLILWASFSFPVTTV